MAAKSKQVTALCTVLPLIIFTLLLLPGTFSRVTPITYSPIGNFIPVCSKERPEHCLTHNPPMNELHHPCNPSNRCRVGKKSLTGTEQIMSKVQVSAAAKLSVMQDHTLLSSGFCHGCWLAALFLVSYLLLV